tara:strand:+ start:589 stop:1125 length:537 start_codon:yes stop_codon:yes gene_type:complete
MEGENLKLALREVGKLIRKNLKQSAKDDEFSASGNLDRSFKYRVEKNELYIFGEQYANALSGGIKNKGKYDYDMAKKLAKWAKIKGMRPMFRLYEKDVDGSYKPTGKFRKVYESSWKSLGFVLARSIAEKGISKRFRYKGSGFIEAVQKETKEQIKKMLKDAYKKDILEQLNTLKAIK